MSDKKQVLSTPQRSRDESEQKDGRSAPCDPPEPFHPNSGNNIIVSTRQKGNFVTGHIRNVPFEYANILPDFLIGKVDCALFISLQYHRLHPLYLQQRAALFERRMYGVRLLLCLADLPADDCEAALLQVSQIAVQHNLSLLLAWSFEEAGRILETMKAFENKPADLIRGQMEIQQRGRMIEVLTTVGAVNKTDAVTLISQFGTMENIFKATKGDLLQCPGMGSRKVNNLLEAINEPFFDAAKMRHN
eukprot:Selendium_serpulae@DN5466_c0_g1_i1.p1